MITMARRELAELPARMGYAEASLDPEEMFYLIGLTKERRAVYWVSRLCRPTPSNTGRDMSCRCLGSRRQFTVTGMTTFASAVLFDPLPLLLSVNA
jgi:hypothetical protein